MTSARWMSEVKPHPVWLFLASKGVPHKYAPFALMAIQFVYTLLTLLPIMPIYSYFYLHILYLSTIFVICVWNGANFYFEIFIEQYSKRIKRYLKDLDQTELEEANQLSSNEHKEKTPVETPEADQVN